MPEITFDIPGMQSKDDADAVLFELQDLPCINVADVDLAQRQAWVNHTPMITADEIVAALLEAGYEAIPALK